MSETNAAETAAHHPKPTSEILHEVATQHKAEKITVADMTAALKDRAYGVLMLVLALPCCIPAVPLLPSLFGVPMMLLGLQMVAGRKELWLPKKVAQKEFKTKTYAKLTEKAMPWMQRLEALSKPRLSFLTHGWAERIIGGWMAILAISVCVPLPGTNTLPSIAIAIIAVGMIEKDGLLVLAGALAGLAAVIVIYSLFGAAIAAAIIAYGNYFVGNEVIVP